MIPELDLDFYGRRAIQDPITAYRPLLEAGAVVRLPRHGVLAVARHAELRALLKSHDIFVSSKGVTMNPLLNRESEKTQTVLVSDGKTHARLRRHLIAPMRPRALETLRDEIERSADSRVDTLVGKGTFEAMEELASHLPLTIVADLVGLEGPQRARMVSWSKATFDLIGPLNFRSLKSIPTALGMLRFQRSLTRDQVRRGTWVDRLFDLHEQGLLSRAEATGMVIDYLAPSLDTTIFATGHLLHRLARHPEQWAILKDDPSRVPDAVSESLRLDSVIRAFTRVCARDTELAGTKIQAGDRILAVYGAANRDPRRYEDPDAFDITRNARDHLAFGHGIHACAGARLATIEMEALLRSIVERVDSIEVPYPPRISNNNTLYGFDRLPLRLDRHG